MKRAHPAPDETSPVVGTSAAIVLPGAAIHHREEFRRYVLGEAEPWHREHLGRLYDLWEQWNREHFAGRMVPPYILLNEPSEPHRYGDCGSVSGFGGRSQIRLRPSLLRGGHRHVQPGPAYAEGRFLFVADVLLHEMIHQWQQEITGEREESYHGHGPGFRDVCNAIGQRLGLARVRTCKARGKERELPSCSQWPENVRPADYYQGAYLPTRGDVPGAKAMLLDWARAYGNAVKGVRLPNEPFVSPDLCLPHLMRAAIKLVEAEERGVPGSGDAQGGGS